MAIRVVEPEVVRSRRIKRTSPTRIARRRTRPGRKLVPRQVSLRPKRKMERNGIGVSIIRHGAFILPRSVK